MTAIHKYKQAMRWFTRPKIDPSIRQLATSDFHQGGRVGMKPGGLVEPGVMYYGKKIPLTEEQQKIAEALAEKKGTTVDQLHRNIRSKIRKEKITLERAKLPHQSLKQYKTNLSAKKEAAQDIYGISYDEVIADTNKKRRRQRMNRIQERIVDGQYVKAMPAAEQGKKAAEAALKASKEKFFNSDQGKQLKWIADNGKNYSNIATGRIVIDGSLIKDSDDKLDVCAGLSIHEKLHLIHTKPLKEWERNYATDNNLDFMEDITLLRAVKAVDGKHLIWAVFNELSGTGITRYLV